MNVKKTLSITPISYVSMIFLVLSSHLVLLFSFFHELLALHLQRVMFVGTMLKEFVLVSLYHFPNLFGKKNVSEKVVIVHFKGKFNVITLKIHDKYAKT